MKLDKAGLELIKHFEGYMHKAYLDTALVWTVGYGTTHFKYRKVGEGDSLSMKTASLILESQVNDHYSLAVEHMVSAKINQNQFDALVSFAYNLGVNALRKSTLLKYLNQGKYKKAAKEFKKWKYVKGKPSKGLLFRRNEEAKLFLA